MIFNFLTALRWLGACWAFVACWWETGQLRFGFGAYRLILDCICFPHEFRRPLERELPWETRVLLRWLDFAEVRRRNGRVWIPVE